MLPVRSPPKRASDKSRQCKNKIAVCFVCNNNIKGSDLDTIKCFNDECQSVKHTYCTGKKLCKSCVGKENKNQISNKPHRTATEKGQGQLDSHTVLHSALNNTFVVSQSIKSSPNTTIHNVEQCTPSKIPHFIQTKTLASHNGNNSSQHNSSSLTTTESDHVTHTSKASPAISEVSDKSSCSSIVTTSANVSHTHSSKICHVTSGLQQSQFVELWEAIERVATDVNTLKSKADKYVCNEPLVSEINDVNASVQKTNAQIGQSNVDEINVRLQNMELKYIDMNNQIDSIHVAQKQHALSLAAYQHSIDAIHSQFEWTFKKMRTLEHDMSATFQHLNFMQSELNSRIAVVDDAFTKINTNFDIIQNEKHNMHEKICDINDMVISSISIPKSNAIDVSNEITNANIESLKNDIQDISESNNEQ